MTAATVTIIFSAWLQVVTATVHALAGWRPAMRALVSVTLCAWMAAVAVEAHG